LFHVFHPLKNIERSDFMPDQCRQKRKEGEKTPFHPFIIVISSLFRNTASEKGKQPISDRAGCFR